MTCPICGGTMLGDGYTTPIHCENVDLDPWIEPDFGPIYCIEELPEMSDEEYTELLEEAYVDTYPDLTDYELNRDLELDKDYEANMPLSPSGTGKVYGWEDDIPF